MLQEDKHILWRASAVLIGLSLPSMLFGKSLMFGLLVLGIITGLMATKDESLRATVKLLLNSRTTLAVIVLLAALMPGVAMGPNPLYALEQWGQVALFSLGAASLFITLREMPGRHLELLLKVLAIATMAVCGLALIDALAHEPRLSGALHGADKALTPYRLNFMSGILAVILPFVWARLTVKSREGEPFAIRIAPYAAAFGLVVAITCGGRAGWVGLAVGLFVFLGMASRYHGLVIHKKHWLAGLALVALGVGLYTLAAGWEFVSNRILIMDESEVSARGMLSGRGEVWAQAWESFLVNPLFGAGVMNYRNMPGAIDLHPHNWILQILVEGGIVGAVALFTLLGLILWRFYGYAKGNLYGVAAFASFIAFLVTGLANTSIFNGWWLTFLIVSTMLGWRAGWGGSELKKRRRASVVVKPGAHGR
ncbi:MAG: O-antigen ligase family protein [Blastochloris viridis]|uniref:O-antigen ligase family protein n=1 Tax=Blastochloris viridis TaxID=1079 RepID=A0A6N4RBE4_BLAVI|nr:MAG: O-antigen ligase family protein [Blastochloris viridis]